jgi:AcrR family transcriptional regulator
MRQIADEAGIAVGGIYNHFTSKEAVFAALLERHQPYSDIAAGLSNVSGKDAAEVVERAARLMVDELLDDPVFFQLSMIDLQEFQGDTLIRFVNHLLPALMDFAGRLVASGQLRRDVPLPVLMRTFAGMVVFYAVGEIIVFSSHPPRFNLPVSGEIDWIGGMVDVFLNGVLEDRDS